MVVEAIQTRGVILMRMLFVSQVGVLSFLFGAYLIATTISAQGPFDDIVRGVFLILLSSIITALGRIWEVLVEIRDK